MKKTLIKGIMILSLLFSLSQYTSADLKPQEHTSVQTLVTLYSAQYGVSASKMMNTIKCENKTLDEDAQSNLTYKKGNRWHKPVGSREQSYGLVQIHLPDNPEVTIEQAKDPNFSIEFMAKNFKAGHAKRWSCYRSIYS